MHECFEVKRSGFLHPDPLTTSSTSTTTTTTTPPPTPEHMARRMTRMYDALDEVARACLADVERGLLLPPNSTGVLSLLDEPPQRRRQRPDDGADGGGGSLTAMRLLHYHKVGTLPPGDAQAMLGEHTDSSLLTVAPRSTAKGLEVAAYRRGPRLGWLDVEGAMSPTDACVFAGEFFFSSQARPPFQGFPSD